MKRNWCVIKADELITTTTIPLREVAAIVGTTDEALRFWYWKKYSAEFRKSRKISNYKNSKIGKSNPMHGKHGDKHPNYIGRASDHKGYFTVLKPDWWAGNNRSKRIFEHHYVYAKHNGLTCIPEGMHVHHIDFNKSNNSPDNLQLMTASEHLALHKQNTSKGE